jgi:hypothetical protein
MLQSCSLYISAGVQAFCSVLMRPAAPAPQVKFVKSNKAAVVRLAVEKPICVELFSSVPQLVSPLHVARSLGRLADVKQVQVQARGPARRCNCRMFCSCTLSLTQI